MNATVRRIVRVSWKIAALALVVGAVIYYLRFKPVSVEALTVRPDTVRSEVMGTGTLDARTKVTISSKITGRIAALGADQNDPVSKDKLLVTLDDSDLRMQVETASASLDATKAALTRADTDIIRAQAVLTQAKLENDRLSQLSQSRAVSQQEVDKAKEALDVAQAGLDSSKAAKVEAEHQVVTAERTLKYQQARLAEAKIQCPIEDGLVVVRYHEVGDIVVPGTAIMDVVCLKEMWVSAWVDESASGALAVGQPVRIVYRSEPDKSYSGEVARLAKQTDRETREFLVDVQVKEFPKNWSVGQRAEVYIQTAKRDGILAVPQRMIVWRNGKAGVFVQEAGRARLREVGVGLRGRELVEIVGGLQGGEVVVAGRGGDGQQLRDGAFVKQ